MEEKIKKYARFLLEGCLNLKANDKLFVIGSTLILDFINVIKKVAQEIGVNDVQYFITNPYIQKTLYKTMGYNDLIKHEEFDKTIYNKMARENYAFLNLYSPIPEFYEEIDALLLSEVNTYQNESIAEYREYQNKGLIKWNISAVPNELWCLSIFGEKDQEKLWNLIFDICLINYEKPILEWNKKIKRLENRSNYLNNLGIDKLIFKNNLGTNLEIGLVNNYLFKSAQGSNLVNMPTEEVFTSPSKYKVNGVVFSSKPLIYNGNVIDEFWLKFKEGKVVDFDAKKGKKIIEGILSTDEGGRYLGEVALVDYDSPISKTNIIFKNTLYDENASCHLALGASFAECIVNGLDKRNEELLDCGLNYSNVHVDFFIGTDDLFVKAVLQNGQEVVIMENGNFVMEG